MPRTIEISHRTILFILGILAGGWIILHIRDILYLLFISFILMTVLRPIVNFLTQFKVPRVVAIFLVYILVFGGIGSVIGSIIPTIVSQSSRLVLELPGIVEQVVPNLDLNLRSLPQELAPLTQNVVRVGFEIFNNVVTLVTILVFTFYFLLGRSNLRAFVLGVAGEETGTRFMTVLKDVEERLGAWARGQMLLMLTIGVMTYIGLVLLHVEYALPLAIFAGLLEIIPMVGPFIGAIPAVLLALTVSPFLALSVAALYFVIQQIENHVIVPQIMRRSVGLSPILTIVAFMIGARFEGVTGAILAIPAILVGQVIINHYLSYKSQDEGSKTA